jgi:hypothetical protein
VTTGGSHFALFALPVAATPAGGVPRRFFRGLRRGGLGWRHLAPRSYVRWAVPERSSRAVAGLGPGSGRQRRDWIRETKSASIQHRCGAGEPHLIEETYYSRTETFYRGNGGTDDSTFFA